ncbi:AAA family ATPase [Anaerobiospirillum sp. NML02-A-032]|nr:AAA family ATPase [Anaerobiospirillum sp. NML02-A-032]MCK0540963.1 AAA family ATPase [Anaerobiospirillum sp. NML02-A-032]
MSPENKESSDKVTGSSAAATRTARTRKSTASAASGSRTRSSRAKTKAAAAAAAPAPDPSLASSAPEFPASQASPESPAADTELMAGRQTMLFADSNEGEDDLDTMFRRRLNEEVFHAASSTTAPVTSPGTASSQPQSLEDIDGPLFDGIDRSEPVYGDPGHVYHQDAHMYHQDAHMYHEDVPQYHDDVHGYPEDSQGYPDESYEAYSSDYQPYVALNSASDRAALKELMTFYDLRKHQDLDFSAQDREDAALTAREKTIVRRALSRNREPAGELLTAASDAARRDEMRINMARFCYAPEELYGERSWFEPYESSPLSSETSSGFNVYFSQADARGLVELARSCPHIERMDVAFVEYLQSHFPMACKYDQQSFNVVIFALFSQMSDGHICINLNSVTSIYECISHWCDLAADLERRNQPAEELRQFIYLAQYYAPSGTEALKKLLSRSVATGSAHENNSPLVFDLDRLYIRRYFDYERQIASYIKNVTHIEFDEAKKERLRELIAILFPKQEDVPGVNWQMVAAAMSATSRFSVISGGPGTGKTTTVLRIILMLICIDERNRKIKMCAPTGKAAARMGESIARQLKSASIRKTIDQLAALTGMSSEQICSFIPTEAVTVKRLIKSVPNRATPVFNAERRLVCDVLVVDEVSMLDMALFYRLIAALENQCQLIMLGDKDQLSSVEAGAVLAELCACLRYDPDSRITRENLDFICYLTGYRPEELLTAGLADHVALLQYSYRSRDVPQIGQLASLVNKPLDQDESAADEQFRGTILDYLEAEERKRESLVQGILDLEGADKESDAVQLRTQEVLDLIAQDKLHAVDFVPLLSQGESADPLMQAAAAAAGIRTSAGLSHDHAAEEFCIHFARNCVRPGCSDNYAPFLEYLQSRNFTVSSDPEELEGIFRLMDQFRVLCSNHSGHFGDIRVNRHIEHEVKNTYLREYAIGNEERFFPGQIVLITKNDNVLNLVNGYVGFCAFLKDDATTATGAAPSAGAGGSAPEDTATASSGAAASAPSTAASAAATGRSRRQKIRLDDGGRRLRGFIPMGIVERDGRSVLDVNIISPMLLTSCESGFAMSVHKSQGSEYDRVCIMLSDRPNRVLTRELVYTAITRAKKSVQLLGPKASLSSSLARSVERASGLALRLRN